MRITVLCFAELAEAIEAAEITLELTAEADVDTALDAVCTLHPAVGLRRGMIAVAVNERYASTTHVLQDGDVMALIGPVSGG